MSTASTVNDPPTTDVVDVGELCAPKPEIVDRPLLIYRVLLVFALLSIPLIFSAFEGFRGHSLDIGSEDHFDGRVIDVSVDLVEIKPAAETMTLSWVLLSDSCPAQRQRAKASDCTAVNIFVDRNLLSTPLPSGHIPSNNVPDVPLFLFNATKDDLDDEFFAKSPIFKTSVTLSSRKNMKSTLQNYPYDEYSGRLFLSARDAVTNQPVRIRIITSSGTVAGYITKTINHSIDDLFPAIDVEILVKRSRMIKAYVVIIVLALWIITLILLFLAVDSAFFGLPRPVEVLVVPVATLFTSTQLRSTFPGAPHHFGARIDFIGILPCLVLMVFSATLTMVTAAVFSIEDHKKHQRRDTLITLCLRRQRASDHNKTMSQC